MRPRAHLGVFLLFLALVAVYTYPLVLDPGHLLPNHHDPRLFSWVMLTIFRNLVTQPALLFHGNAFYPHGSTLAYTEPLLTPALVAGPLHALTGNPVLAYNLTLLGFWALSGWAMYAVALWLTGRHAAALVAALVFTLSPYRTDYHLEFQMELMAGIPLAVYALVRFLEEQRARYLGALVVVSWLQAVAVWYYGVILGFGLVAIALQYAALRWSGWRPRALGLAALGGGALAVALAPVAWPFFQVRRELGFERTLAAAVRTSADVLTYLETGATRLYRFAPTSHVAETSLFLGVGALALVTLSLLWLRRDPAVPRGRGERLLAGATAVGVGLAVLALATRQRIHVGPLRAVLPFSAVAVGALALALGRHALEGRRRWREGQGDRRLSERDWVALLLVLAGLGFLLSLGPVVHLGRRPLGAGLYAWLYPYLLPLHAVRVATRFGALVVFAGALLAGFGVKWVSARVSPRVAGVLAGAVALVLLAEYATFPMHYGRVSAAPRPVDEVLRADPDDVAVLEVPTNVTFTDSEVMFRSLGHGKRVVNGFSGFVPGLVRELSAILSRPGPPFPSPETEGALRRIYPLRYLIVRLGDPALTEPWRPVWRGLRSAPPPFLRFRGSFGSEDLYEITPLPERGDRVERWVSYAFLRNHPVLRAALRPLDPEVRAEQWAEVLLNGRLVERVALRAAVDVRRRLPPPDRVAAPNVITLRYGYTRPAGADAAARYRIGTTGATSPGDLRVRSAGLPRGRVGSITLDGMELSPGLRGYNLVAVDPGGRILGVATFDTFAGSEASDYLAAWVAALPAGTIVAGAVKDEASGRLSQAAVDALRTLGVTGDLRGRFRESHAFVGVKGAPPGSAVEALGPGAVEVAVGDVEAAGRAGLEVTAFALEPGNGG